MKKIITLLLIILSVSSFAQKGFYLKPTIGAGISKLTFRKDHGSGLEQVPGFGYKAGVGVGYHFKRLGIESGLSYTSIAYGLNNLVFESNFQPPSGNIAFSTYDLRTRFNFITLPIFVTYNVPLASKISIQPQVGFALNHNLNGKNVFLPHSVNDPKMNHKIPRRVTSCSGNASVLLQYKLGNQLSLFAGPAVNYIYSDIDHLFQHSYSNLLMITLDAGITMKL